jgi:hypothetical protein
MAGPKDARALYQRSARAVGCPRRGRFRNDCIERIRLSWDHLEPDTGDGAGGELLGEELDCIEVELTGSLYDLFNYGCTIGELGSFGVGCMAVNHSPATQLETFEPLHPQVFVLATRNHENWDSYHVQKIVSIAHISYTILMRYSLGGVFLL